MKENIKIGIYQTNPTVGAMDENCRKITDNIKNLPENTFAIFPELATCGYPPEDLILNPSFLKQAEQTVDNLLKTLAKEEGTYLIPTPHHNNGQTYNAAFVCHKGKAKQTILKHHLPNYTVFNEPRIFASGALPDPVNFKGHRLGVMICEDVWKPDVAQHLKNKGAEILISINASPFQIEKEAQRHNVVRQRVQETALPIIYLNMFGGQDELVFDGRSFVMDAQGNILHQSPAFKEDSFFVAISKNSEISIEAQSSSVSVQHDETSLTYEALKTGLQDYVHKNGFKKVLLGLSGGIDSALTAAVAADALGPENIRCIALPSAFTSQESLDDAKACAETLNIKQYEVIPINEAVTTFEQVIPDLKDTAHENTQSRTRGVILMALSNMTGELLLTTGNKSEMAVGYCTLYGDMNGGFNPLKDVYKTDVYKLAKWRGLPNSIIEKAPSAELRPDQTDQDSLPPYDLLDDILKLLIEHDDTDWNNPPDHLKDLHDRCLKHPDIVRDIARLLRNNEFKRFQSAPGTRITPRAFGRDRRYPITNHFVNKIEKLS